jgi:hypothetical protein
MDFPLLIDELFTISNGKSVADYIIFIKFIYLFLSKWLLIFLINYLWIFWKL